MSFYQELLDATETERNTLLSLPLIKHGSTGGEYIEEEMGHQEWVLNDIAECGADKEAVRNSVSIQTAASHETEMMVAYAYDMINRVNPIGFFGMVLVLEGTSTAVATQAGETLMTSLNLPKNAFSYLLSHGSLDLEHIDFYESLMNQVTNKEDQAIVIHAAKQFYKLYGDIFKKIEAQTMH